MPGGERQSTHVIIVLYACVVVVSHCMCVFPECSGGVNFLTESPLTSALEVVLGPFWLASCGVLRSCHVFKHNAMSGHVG